MTEIDNDNEFAEFSLPSFFDTPSSDDLRQQADMLDNMADLMDARDILPEVEIEVEGWLSLPEDQRPPYPDGQFTAALQGYLGIDADGIFGFNTAQSLLSSLAEELNGGFDDAIIVDLNNFPNLSTHLQNIAAPDFQAYQQAYGGYVIQQEAAFTEALQQTAVSYYSSCQYEDLFFDPMDYIENFLQRMEEGADPEDALAQHCDAILSRLDPEMQDAVREEVFNQMNQDLAELYTQYKALNLEGIHDASYSEAEPAAPDSAPELMIPKL